MPPLKTESAPSFSLLEDAPLWVIHAPLAVYAVWLMLRHGSLTLPAIANPSILIGGIAGESKTDLSSLIDPSVRKHFAPFVTVGANMPASEAYRTAQAAGLSYPLVAKPDIGLNGRGVKIVRSDDELARHFAAFPPSARMLLQQYVADEGEAGVFYVRKPSEKAGRITSLTLKHFPSIVGDGRSTLRDLILASPATRKRAHIYLRRNARYLGEVVPAGEARRVVSVGNHVRGAVFEDGEAHITPALSAAVDRIAQGIKDFHFGRFDVRYPTLDALKEGRDFTIIEYNGASSEPTHVRDPRTHALKVWRDFMAHWRYAFEIGAEQRMRGIRPVPMREILHVLRKEQALVGQYPDEE